jgi:hypothetical protein
MPGNGDRQVQRSVYDLSGAFFGNTCESATGGGRAEVRHAPWEPPLMNGYKTPLLESRCNVTKRFARVAKKHGGDALIEHGALIGSKTNDASVPTLITSVGIRVARSAPSFTHSSVSVWWAQRNANSRRIMSSDFAFVVWDVV